MLSQNFINEVKDAVDMVKLAQQYTDLKKVGDGIWQGPCPHPDHNDGTPSFTVWEKHQSWACMGCHSGRKDSKYKNYGSDCFAFMQWMDKSNWKQSILKLAERVDIKPEEDKYSEFYAHRLRQAKAYSKNISKSVYDYLAERGLNQKDIDKWMIGFDGSRITFPLFDRYRKVLGFTKRSFNDPNSAKYKNSPNGNIFNKSSYFYGIHLLDDSLDEIRITEGSMDVIMADKYGVRNIVATLGTAFTEQHAAIIKNLGKTPVLCMDGDSAGLNAIRKTADLFASIGVSCKVLILPQGKDMADVANEYLDSMEDYVEMNSITYGQMVIQDVVRLYDSKVNEMRIKLYPQTKSLLDSIKNQDERKVITDYIRQRMGIEF